MTDKVTIANMALGHLRAPTIASFEEISVPGNYVRTYYDLARQATLEGFDWNFARKRRTLALLSESPPDTWTYRYEYPSGCLKVRYLGYPGTRRPLRPIPFEIELDDAGQVRTILTDQQDATAVCTIDIENPALFAASFIDAMSWRLAALLAVPLAGKRDDEKRCFDWWQYLLREAEAGDANEQQADPDPDGEFLAARA